MDFTVSNYWVLKVGNVDVWITETIFNTWLIMLALIIFAIFVRVKLNSFKEVPTGFQNFIEMVIEFFDGLIVSSAGERFMYLGNWFFMVFAFVLCSNLSGLLTLRPPTADWATTITLALCTFFIIQINALAHRKTGYLKSFIEPNIVFLPINLIGELARPVSLSFRLYGNILSGMILLNLLYSLAPMVVRFILPIPLHGFFDLFAGVLQTYIFTVLSLTFIGAASTVEE